MPSAAGCVKESFIAYMVCRKEPTGSECRFVDNTNSSVCTYKQGPLPACRPGAAGWGGMVVRAGRIRGDAQSQSLWGGGGGAPGGGRCPWIAPGIDGYR